MIDWFWKPFDALSTLELYDILRARQQVFIIEQTCIYPDLDGADLSCWHLMGTMDKAGVVAYLRVLPPTEQRAEPAIGRVLVTPSARGQGLGRQLLAEGMTRAQQLFPGYDIVLSAQHHLEQLYGGFGFRSVSEPYLEDGIPHIAMRWSTNVDEAVATID
ncbi:MAG: GNAT family N-acetyltransferase [Cyanobacteria bacterium P01_B01_bin.77]